MSQLLPSTTKANTVMHDPGAATRGPGYQAITASAGHAHDNTASAGHRHDKAARTAAILEATAPLTPNE